MIEVLAEAGHQVVSLVVDDPDETQGVNDRAQLAEAEAELRRRTNERWMREGVTHGRPRRPPTSTPASRSPPTSPCSRARCCRATTTVGAGSDIGPYTRLVGHPGGRACRGDRECGPPRRPSATTPSWARMRCSNPVRRSRRVDAQGRSTLRVRRSRWGARRPGPQRKVVDGARHQEEAAHRLRAGQPAAGRGDRRLPRRSSSASPTAPSSPTARSTAASASRSGAWTSSSSRATAPAATMSINDTIFEHLQMVDAAKRASAKRITAVMPFYGYGRQDRKSEGREPISAKLVANMFTVAGAGRLVSVDLHSGPDPGFLRPAVRPPHGHAGAGRATSRRTWARTWSSCRPTPGG